MRAVVKVVWNGYGQHDGRHVGGMGGKGGSKGAPPEDDAEKSGGEGKWHWNQKYQVRRDSCAEFLFDPSFDRSAATKKDIKDNVEENENTNHEKKEAAGRFRICIDCSFESTMPEHYVSKLVNQLRICYSANRRSQHPVLYSICSLSGKTNELLTKIGGFKRWKEHAFISSEKSLTEMYPDKSKLIYLTNDSPNEFDHLDDSKTYVIGGIVRGRKRETIQKAEKLGIATARLPVEKYVNAYSTNLHIKRVFEILLKYRESNND